VADLFNIKFTYDLSAFNAACSGASAAVQTALHTGIEDACTEIQGMAQERHKFQTQTGAAEHAIQVKPVVDNGVTVTGEVFLNSRDCPHVIYQHEGTGLYGPMNRQYPISPKNAKALHFVSGGQGFFAKHVLANGILPDPFLINAAKKLAPEITQKLTRALANALRSAGF